MINLKGNPDGSKILLPSPAWGGVEQWKVDGNHCGQVCSKLAQQSCYDYELIDCSHKKACHALCTCFKASLQCTAPCAVVTTATATGNAKPQWYVICTLLRNKLYTIQVYLGAIYLSK